MKKKKVKKNQKATKAEHKMLPSTFFDPKTDPLGSYTGTVTDAPYADPVQDADDL